MKQNYNPKRLNKKQRHQKKWIPIGIYCHHDDLSPCPFWHSLDNHKHKAEECGANCKEDCNTCDEIVSYCSFLNYIEYGQYPLGDMCKVCGVKDVFNFKI